MKPIEFINNLGIKTLVFQDLNNVEPGCLEQVKTLMNCEAYKNSRIRLMPDLHQGVSGPIGFTCTITDKVVPATVGVDIGCGMLAVRLKGIKKSHIDFKDFDDYIKTHIPSGRNIHDSIKVKFTEIQDLRCYRELRDTVKFERAIGTLGGGNHFIELDEDSNGMIYVVVHSGSRNLGKQVADYYQNLADGICNRNLDAYFIEKNELIAKLKAEGRKSEIQSALKVLSEKYKESIEKVPKDLAWITGSHLEDYLHDMYICQDYASLNREIICKTICNYFKVNWTAAYKFETVHNYIDIKHKIIRKGAIDCSEGKTVLIPINMRDGSIIAYGKGNSNYNCSGPHGAGRLMSRNQAKENIKLEDFQESMKGIYTSCVSEKTIDESPMAYKSIDSVLPWIEDTAEVVDIIKPIWNYKAEE